MSKLGAVAGALLLIAGGHALAAPRAAPVIDRLGAQSAPDALPGVHWSAWLLLGVVAHVALQDIEDDSESD